MSKDARRKERHRLKRKQKQLARRKEQSRTALQRIAAEGGRLECWVTPRDWKQNGLASIQVLGHTSGGRSAFAAFLVDLWCVGLKDAFGRGDVPGELFREQNIEKWIEQMDAVELKPKIARRLVAGGIRFSRQNGFGFPSGWDKWVTIFGRDILDEAATADLSDFGIDGGLRYVGTMDFLRQRLIGMTVEQFLERPDVKVVIGGDSIADFDQFDEKWEGEEEDDDDELSDEDPFGPAQQALDEAADGLADAVRKWCAEKQVPPQPQLDRAAFLTIAGGLPLALGMKSGMFNDGQIREHQATVQEVIGARPPEEREPLRLAMEQIQECMREQGTFPALLEAARSITPPGDHP